MISCARPWTLLPGAVLACCVLVVATLAAAAQNEKLACEASSSRYEVSFRDRGQHILHVRLAIAAQPRGDRELQLPVWNALYQVRDFSQHIPGISAQNESGEPLPLRKIEKTSWRVAFAHGCAVVGYDIFLDEAGPFDAQVNDEHAFLNWAQVLIYPADGLAQRVQIRLADLPHEWKVRDAYVFAGADAPGAVAVEGEAANYDSLVDSPVELGTFTEAGFTQGGAKYRVVVHGKAADYDMQKLVGGLQKIVAAETEWMQDRPFDQYTFLYHFPHGPAGGGMEHAYSSAMDISGQRMALDPMAFAGVTAHEFFHLWNVKRIRPQSLEPIDYTREMYTRALWFSEGVTSTVQEYMLVRAGLIDEDVFLEHLSQQIGTLQERPAHSRQSAEESSLDTWFDKYPFYRQPERSINYYNKGQIIGVLLDLRMREVSHGTKSLRDLFQFMNANYAKKHLYYADSEGVRDAAEKITGADFHDFFARYVSGVDEIPYDDFFRTVGLKLTRGMTKTAYAGFTTGRNFGKRSEVVWVEPQSQADHAGLKAGDVVASINGRVVNDLAATLAAFRPGEAITLHVRGRNGDREVKLKVETRETEEYFLEDAPGATDAQRARRTAWVRGDSEAGKNAGAATGTGAAH